MINAESLNSLKLKELGELASSLGLTGWTRLSKSQLREFLLKNAAETSPEEDKPKDDEAPKEPKTKEPKTKEPKKRRASKAKQTSLLDIVKTPETKAEPAPPKKKRASKKAAKTDDAKSQPASEAKFEVVTLAVVEPPKADDAAPAPAAKKPRKPRAEKKKSAEPTLESPAPVASTSDQAKGEAKADDAKAGDDKPIEKAPRKRRASTRAKAKQGEAAQDAAPVVQASAAEPKGAEPKQTAAATPDEATPAPAKKPRAKRGRKSVKATPVEEAAPATEAVVETKDAATEEAQATPPAESASEVKPKRRARKPRATQKDGDEPKREESETSAPAEGEKKKTAERIVESSASRDRDKADRIVLSVCDPYWLRACWQISSQLVERVRSAMGRRWHASSLAIRLFEIDREQQSAVVRRTRVEDLIVKREIDNWYVQVDNPPRAFMVELGFLSRDGEFFTLVSSNTVETPQRFIHDPFSRPVFGEPGIYDQRFYPGVGEYARGALGSRRRTNSLDLDLTSIDRPAPTQRSADVVVSKSGSNLQISVDAEIIVKGKTSRGARVFVKDKPIRVTREGEFFARFTLPERRHVFPVVATAPDDSESQTVILAVDRNTKTLDPVYKEDEE